MAKQSGLTEIPYRRQKAVDYANAWAHLRNPKYYDFSEIGGDCTNFASQCVYAGCEVMNYIPTFGWYYNSAADRAPAWTSVRYLYQFLTENKGAGPYGYEAGIGEILPGDLVQLRFIGETEFGHSPVITAVETFPSHGGTSPKDGQDDWNPELLSGILVAAHTIDSRNRPLSTYQNVAQIRFIHIAGARRPESL